MIWSFELPTFVVNRAVNNSYLGKSTVFKMGSMYVIL